MRASDIGIMPILKTDADVGKYLTDKGRIIPQSHLVKVCKKGKGASACRYLCSVAQGFTCVKNTPLKAAIDKEANGNAAWRSKGDNCDGFGDMNEQKESRGEEGNAA